MSDLDQLRRNVRVLDLLTASFMAYAAGDRDAADLLITDAKECDPVLVSVLKGGMLIGEVPRPEEDLPAWMEYVDAARERLATTEEATDERP